MSPPSHVMPCSYRRRYSFGTVLGVAKGEGLTIAQAVGPKSAVTANSFIMSPSVDWSICTSQNNGAFMAVNLVTASWNARILSLGWLVCTRGAVGTGNARRVGVGNRDVRRGGSGDAVGTRDTWRVCSEDAVDDASLVAN